MKIKFESLKEFCSTKQEFLFNLIIYTCILLIDKKDSIIFRKNDLPLNAYDC